MVAAWPRRALGLLLLLVLAACQPPRSAAPDAAERAARAAAERNRLDLERCRRDRRQLNQELAELRRTRAELARVEGDAYVPAAKPEPMDPDLAARFSLADQELDSLRYQQALERWQSEDQRRRQAWQQNRTGLLQRLREQERRQLDGLRRLNSSLFEPDTPNQLAEAAVAQYASCEPERFQGRSRPSPKRAG